MSDNLYVNNDELVNIQEEIQNLQNRFISLNNEFETKLNELNKYWSGPEYNLMKENVRTKMQPITGEDGFIKENMTGMIKEIAMKADNYTNIQRRNMSYWG